MASKCLIRTIFKKKQFWSLSLFGILNQPRSQQIRLDLLSFIPKHKGGRKWNFLVKNTAFNNFRAFSPCGVKYCFFPVRCHRDVHEVLNGVGTSARI